MNSLGSLSSRMLTRICSSTSSSVICGEGVDIVADGVTGDGLEIGDGGTCSVLPKRLKGLSILYSNGFLKFGKKIFSRAA